MRDTYTCPHCETPREDPDEECCSGHAVDAAVRVMQDMLDTMETPRSQKATKAWTAMREFVRDHKR